MNREKISQMANTLNVKPFSVLTLDNNIESDLVDNNSRSTTLYQAVENFPDDQLFIITKNIQASLQQNIEETNFQIEGHQNELQSIYNEVV